MTILQFKNQYKKNLIKSPSPDLDIDVLLCFILNCNKTYLLLNRNQELLDNQLDFLEKAVEKRQSGLPIAYITGHKEFYGYDFEVSPDVLIPKPDTEILVEHAIDLITDIILSKTKSVLTVCDMCTGSGCIGLSVLKTLIDEPSIPNDLIPAFTLVDISNKALDLARKNAQNLIPKKYLERVRFIRSNLFENISFSYNVILTNPPYIPRNMAQELLLDGRSEPILALDGDVNENGDFSQSFDGLGIIRRLIPQCSKHLVLGGTVFMETGEYNAVESAKIAEMNGFSRIKIHQDLEKQLRVVEGTKLV